MRKRTARPLALALIGLLYSAAPTQSSAQDVLACVVAAGGTPVVGATVVLAGTLYGGVSDTTGCVRLPGVPAGRYTIVVQRAGFVTREIGLTVVGATNTVLDIRLSRPLPESDTVQGAPTSGRSVDRAAGAYLFDGYLPVARVSRTGFFQDGGRHVVLPVNARFAGMVSVDPAVIAHPFLPVYAGLDAQGTERVSGGRGVGADLGVRPIGSIAVGSNVGAARVGLGVESIAPTSRLRFLAANVSGRRFSDGSGFDVDDQYVATSLSASAERGFGSYVVAAQGEGLLVSTAEGRGTYQPYQPALADLRFDIRRPVGRGFNSLQVSGRIHRDGFNAVDSAGLFAHVPAALSGGRRLTSIDLGATGTVERTLGDAGTARGRIGASLGTLESRDEETASDTDENTPVAAARVYPSSLLAYRVDAGGAVMLNRGATTIEFDAELVLENADASDAKGVGLERVTEVLPSVGAVVGRTSRFGSSNVTMRLSARYREWAPDPVLRVTSPTVFWGGQRQIVAIPLHPLTRFRSAVQYLSVDLDRRSLTGGVAVGHEWLLDVPTVVPVDTTDGGGLIAGYPAVAWGLETGSGRHGFIAAFVEMRVMRFFAMGVDAHLLRSWSGADPNALMGTPSSTVRGYFLVSGASGYPYIRWTTTVRLARDRVGTSTLELRTPGSSETDLELGLRRGLLGVIIGVANLGNRVVLDHAMIRAAGDTTPAYPGRRLYVGVRLE